MSGRPGAAGRRPPAAGRQPIVAIVGRPNVGKSTLFNRLVGGRPALVLDTAGVTRDRRYGEVDYFGRTFTAIDTGGLDPEAESDAIGAGIHRQARAAIEEADAVVFVVDGHAGPTPVDRELAQMLRRSGKPLLTAVNKIDGPKRDMLVHELHELGLGELYPVSAAHGRGVDAMLEALVALLPPAEPVDELALLDADADADAEPDADAPLRIAFIGKPNAGKSSLVNRLVGVERSLVHDRPGTTTDPVDSPFEYGGRSYVLVDTAGIRRRAKVHDPTERISVSLAMGQMRRADVAVLVIDATLGPSEQDARVLGMAADAGCAIVIALNKADLLGPGDAAKVREQLADELYFAEFAEHVMISALRGDGVADLMGRIDAAAAQRARRISTGELNRFYADVCERFPPPTQGGRSVRIHYLTQGGTRPPAFILWCNRPKYLAESYKRFLTNQLRAHYGFRGTPVRLFVKKKGG